MSLMRTVLVAGVAGGAFGALSLAAQTTPTRVYNEATPNIVLPTVVSREQPPYTSAALQAQVAGDAAVDVTVDVDGSVRDVLLVKSVDAVHGLDEAAVMTAGRWVFKPGTLRGQPVPVRVRLDLHFSLK